MPVTEGPQPMFFWKTHDPSEVAMYLFSTNAMVLAEVLLTSGHFSFTAFTAESKRSDSSLAEISNGSFWIGFEKFPVTVAVGASFTLPFEPPAESLAIFTARVVTCRQDSGLVS